MHILAQQPIDISGGTSIGGEGLGPFGKTVFGTGQAGGTKALTSIINGVSSIIGFLTIAGGIWFLFQMLFGGYEWISSGGDAKKLTAARDRLSHGIVGFTIIVGSWALLAVVGQFFGYDILLSQPSKIIDSIKFQ